MATDMEKKLLESRVILVQGYIDTPKASQIVFELLQMSALNDKEPIQLFIGSTGGNYLDMLAIYDTIRSIPNVVSGIGMGAVANYSALLLAGYKKGSRFALNHCRFTIEQPYGDTTVMGKFYGTVLTFVNKVFNELCAGKLYTVQAKIINHTEGVSGEIEGIVGETVGTVTKVNA